jgi:hypothetical protein
MTGDNSAVVGGKDRVGETEPRDRRRNLGNLLVGMRVRELRS